MNTNLLNQLSFDIVKDKVIEDKMKECKFSLNQINKNKKNLNRNHNRSRREKVKALQKTENWTNMILRRKGL